MPRRQYRNPPIREATCEFRFAPGTEWNLTYPGIFSEKIKLVYPGKPKELKQLTIETNLSEGEKGAPPAVVVKEALTKVQFSSDNGKELVAIGPNALSIHILRPYPGWEKFRPRIEEALKHYSSVASPIGIRRIGIRYINQLDLPDNQAKTKDLFVAVPGELRSVRGHIENFVIRSEYVCDDEPIRVVITFARSALADSKSSVLLDIDTYWQWPAEPLDLAQAMSKVDILRERERDAFEGLITDRAREIFDAE